MQKGYFCKVKWVNGKSKIGRGIEHKEKQNRQEKKQILSRPNQSYVGKDFKNSISEVSYLSVKSLLQMLEGIAPNP